MPPLPDLLHRMLGLLPRSVVERLFEWRWKGRFPPLLVRLAGRAYRSGDHVVPFGAAAGLRLDPGQANMAYSLGLLEPGVQDALQRHLHAGAVFYDIGANVGYFTLIGARLVGPTGCVHAFEPHPGNAAALRHNLALNAFDRVTVWECAVTASEEEVTLYLADQSTLATLGKPAATEAPGASLQVAGVAIDTLVAQGRIAPPDVVKIDVEGAEADVLTSMTLTLRDHHPVVICELHGTNRAVGQQLRALGYDVVALETSGSIEDAPGNAHALATAR